MHSRGLQSVESGSSDEALWAPGIFPLSGTKGEGHRAGVSQTIGNPHPCSNLPLLSGENHFNQASGRLLAEKHVLIKDAEREVEADISASSVVSLAPAASTVHGINSNKHSREAAVKLSLYIP
jgi:hypothetical protein